MTTTGDDDDNAEGAVTTTATATATTATTACPFTPASTAAQLGQLAAYHARKQPGSIQYYKTWRTWIDAAVSLTRQELLKVLAEQHVEQGTLSSSTTTIDATAATTALTLQLGMAADAGVMPSFQNAGARTGYAAGHFGRAKLLANVLFHQDVQPPMFRATLERLLNPLLNNDACESDDIENGRVVIRVTSLGGGPGFDFCAVALLASLHNHARLIRGNCTTCPPVPVSVQATVFDYEQGWKDLVEDMTTATQAAVAFDISADHACEFGGRCDITRSLVNDEANAICSQLLDSTDVWICQYCVTENARLLVEHDFVYFRELFAGAKDASLFVFTDTSHRMWPALIDVAMPTGFEIAFVHGQGRWKSGYQLVLRKNAQGSSSMLVVDIDLCEGFRRAAEMQRQKLDRGYIRPARRTRTNY